MSSSSSILTSSLSVFNLKTKNNNNPSSCKIRNCSNSNHNSTALTQTLKSFATSIVLAGASLSVASKFPAKAESLTPSPVTLTENHVEEEQEGGAIESLKTLLQQKLENGEDQESLSILERLVLAQPEVIDWKFLRARLLSEMGKTQDARNVFEEILSCNPLSFEALFENALLMDRCGEGEAVIKRLEEALEIAQEQNKVKEARDVRLIMAQVQFLQKNVEEALKSYQELEIEDPYDFRPYFCKGMIYSLLDRNAEAKEQFAKYRQLSPKKFEVEGYLRTPLSRMKLFGANDDNN
ncbi:protein SLOW GREEN 1, chloroplastic [Melia azedarach]|uniref:Protein SLOW GREEN 1, chloroplastic n=2 Tax=Melia azedarach TaxID=155640 RepID=A0ACC1XHB1_MELAZ|nr:protein SLOW GREEN 1, chloroplastic [Melia azedarach]KAJ4710316.1 protein SLOW GREEN 1, chloroplastic [Melia azedarach]